MMDRTRKVSSGHITQEYTMPSSVLNRQHTWISRWTSIWPHFSLLRSCCCHSIYLSLSYSYRTYLILFIFVFNHYLSTTSLVMARPAPDTWTNPCNIDLEARSRHNTDSVGLLSSGAIEQYNKIVMSTKHAKEKIGEIKERFVTETFGNPTFMKEFEWISYDWLPKIPPEGKKLEELEATPEDISKSLADSYEFLQKFAVAVDQMILDQVMYEGNFLDAFRTVEQQQKLPLCVLQETFGFLQIERNPDVSKSVMSEEYRTIESETTRNVRDYIILRDNANALLYIASMFEQLISKIEGNT